MHTNAQNHAAKKRVLSGYGVFSRLLSTRMLGFGLLTTGLLGPVTNHTLAQSASDPLDLSAYSVSEVRSAISDTPLRLNQLTPVPLGQQNLATQSTTGVTGGINADDGSAQEISVGTFTLRPSIQSQILHESEKTGVTKETRVYNQTIIEATLQSDWSRHSLDISGTATLQNNIKGTLEETPGADVNAELQLELGELLTANIQAGYDLRVENRTDPNAISNATSQAKIQTIDGSLTLSKDIGIIRGGITGAFSKEKHGDALSANNTIISGRDRDLLDSSLALRIQYAANPVLMPFVEGRIGRIRYEQLTDSNGIKRSFSNYALRAGLVADVSDKLSGDFAVGYIINKFDDPSLVKLKTTSFDSNLNWSPRIGTNASFGFATTIEPSTAVDVSGATRYQLSAGLTQQISNNLSADLGASYGLRKFTGVVPQPRQVIYGINAGLDWSINRYLSFNADAEYTKTKEAGTSTIENVTLGLGLTLTR